MALKKKQKLMIEALKSQLGVITAAINQVGIARQTHYNWINECPEYKQAVDEAELILKDFGENSLFKLMKEGNPAAVIFFNKTKNKDRGYVEKQEIEHSTGNEGIKIQLVEMSDKEVEDVKRSKEVKTEQESDKSNENSD